MNPVYKILLEQAAQRDLKKLTANSFQKIIMEIKALTEDPRPANCRKIVGTLHDWRIRVGTFRIIYEIDDKSKVIKIMRVRHRREVY